MRGHLGTRISRAKIISALGIALALVCLAPLAGSAAEAPRPHMRVEFIVDSTSDMATLLGGGSKLAAAGNALASVLPNHAGKLDIGVLVYGHRISGQGACTDIDRLRPMGPIEAGGLGDPFSGLKTKGDAPVASSLSTAFAAKDMVEGGTAMVLIAGGPDSCQADPCEVAGKFAADHNIPVHVIAIDAGGEAEPLQALKCIADNTKGGFWRVGSTMELAAALDDALAAVVKQGAAPAQAAAETLTPAAGVVPGGFGNETIQPVATLGKPSDAELGLTALLTDGGPQLTTGLAWRVFVAAGGAKGPIKLVATSAEANPSFKLPSGDYLVNVAFGRAYITRPLKVVVGAQTAQLVINAGGLKIGAQLADGSLAASQLVNCDVFSDQRDQFGNRTKVLAGIHPGVVVRLNSGLYHIAATYGDANATVGADVGVEAGRITDAAFMLTGAKVTFKLVQQAGGEALAGTSWTILGAGGESIKHSVAALPTHILAAGSYTVAAERAGKSYTQEFTVKPSESLQVEVLAAAEQ